MFKVNKHEVLSRDVNFNDLSLTDLIEARDLFHVHLINKLNVIATAVGRYRIRKTDPLPGTKNYNSSVRQPNRPEKTLENTEVRDYSWPCILVFVKKWLLDQAFRRYENMNEIIPKNVYMPDGRIVPICVIVAPRDYHNEDIPDQSQILFPSNQVGGGFPLIVESQGVQRVATLGCVVTNGNKYFALTNKHVAGERGAIIYTRMKGILTRIGVSSGYQIGNLPFSEVYPEWTSKNLFINSDIGLIEIDDIRMWRTDIFGLEQEGEFGKLADLNVHNFTLKLIGSKVTGFGSISGKRNGEIAALFYRFKSVGGYEYASDFLIGPGNGGANADMTTRVGDSGALWLLETKDAESGKKTFMPIAVQWGQHTFTDKAKNLKAAYALATSLSNVLRILEVDLVRGWNLDNDYTWGKLGHYSIAHMACRIIKATKLKQLINNNLEIITFGYDDLTIQDIDKGLKKIKADFGFVPLADVPDLVWKLGGQGIRRGKESPNHFADMDKKDSANKTLLEHCTGNYKTMKFLTPNEWLGYYTDPLVQDKSRGILPFRIWQIYEAMKTYAAEGDAVSFVAAAGILAHYVGDACQPLHISYMFNGLPKPDGTIKGVDVHGVYETTMINKFIGPIMENASTQLKKPTYKTLLPISSGKEAAGATVELMKKTLSLAQPKDLVNIMARYSDVQGLGKAAVAEKMWQEIGESSTGEIFANGAWYLASMWEGAWKAGKGNQHVTDLQRLNMDDVVKTYERQEFLPSVNIKEISQILGL